MCMQDLLNMMVSKAVLYEPVKELCDKFPAWMQSNSASTPPDDLERYDTAAVFCFLSQWHIYSVGAAAAALMRARLFSSRSHSHTPPA